jgi:hypothetical protein
MDWIYYHEVMSEFSLRHWAERSINSFCKGPLAMRPNNITADELPVSHSGLEKTLHVSFVAKIRTAVGF